MGWCSEKSSSCPNHFIKPLLRLQAKPFTSREKEVAYHTAAIGSDDGAFKIWPSAIADSIWDHDCFALQESGVKCAVAEQLQEKLKHRRSSYSGCGLRKLFCKALDVTGKDELVARHQSGRAKKYTKTWALDLKAECICHCELLQC